MDIITSNSNKIVKHVRALHTKKGRTTAGAFLVEGAKFVGEIAPPWEIEFIAASQSFAKSHGLKTYGNTHTYIVADHIFTTMCDAVTPQGILAVVKQRTFGVSDVLQNQNPLLLILDEINDPGNLGAMLRIAHGLGLCGVILSENCADVYNPKVVRSSAGSVFHAPFAVAPLPEAVAHLKARNITVFAACASAENSLYNLDFRGPSAILIGNEARGLRDNALQRVDEHVKIPIVSESLNASVACGILAYEAFRQRCNTL
ncbi:MAG: RNA methyltransferase [Defluviitaleaceae bacterium]|nr:RNA methyltransferase [Defluviitaleaceae bacterium]